MNRAAPAFYFLAVFPMSLSPTTGMNRLSLESMPLQSRSHRQMASSQDDPVDRSTERDSDVDVDVDEDDESVSGDSMEEHPTVVRSPTGLRYNIGHLSEETQEVVRSLFGEIVEEPLDITLKWCDRLSDQGGNDDFYAFQMSEVVPRSVRIGSPQSKYGEPECRCGAKPCKHLIWLSDLIASQVLYSHNPDKPLTLNERGYAEELGSPFKRISEMRLDVLASSLHCDVGHPASKPRPSTSRKAEAREILASVAEVDEYDLPNFRPDLQEDDFDHTSLIHRSDFEATLFSLLLASHSLTAWVRSQLRPSDLPRDRFRLIHQRVLRVLSDLDVYSAATRASPGGANADVEGPRDVAWAARSIERCVEEIRVAVASAARRQQDGDGDGDGESAPLAPWERASAARALVRILRAVAERNTDAHRGATQDDRNLYARLVGNRDTGFVRAALELLVDQNQFVEELEDILELVGASGVVAGWWAGMKRVVARMRSWRGTGTGKGTGTGAGAGTDRSRKGKAPLTAMPPPPPGFSRSSSASSAPAARGDWDEGEAQRTSAQGAASAAAGPSRDGRAGPAGGGAGGSSRGGAGSKRSSVDAGSDRGPKRAR